METIQFIKKPQKGNKIKIYLENNKVRYGEALTVIERKSITNGRDCLLEVVACKSIEEVDFKDIDYFLPTNRIMFVD
jgi:hypothetical protein